MEIIIKSTFILSILSLASLVASPDFTETHDIYSKSHYRTQVRQSSGEELQIQDTNNSTVKQPYKTKESLTSLSPKYKTGDPKVRTYFDISMGATPGLTKITLYGSPIGANPVYPSVGFGRRWTPKEESIMGYDTNMSFSFTIGSEGIKLPAIELIGGVILYQKPKRNTSSYFGFGTGVSFPRIVPFYMTFGTEYNRLQDRLYKVELQLSSCAIPDPELFMYSATAKVSYGIGF